MSAAYLMDTDWAIDYLNGQNRNRRHFENIEGLRMESLQ